jgi:cytoskeletal protein CcmA (bactofilin family)
VVVTDKINCGGVIVRGRVKGDIRSTGTVLVGPEAEIKGNVTAPAIAVGAGAILEGKFEIGKKTSPDDNPNDNGNGRQGEDAP